MNDTVDKPSHYRQGNIEVIDFIRDQDFDFLLGNAVKYVSRARHKGNYKQDLEKAVWYLNRAISECQDPGYKDINCIDERRGSVTTYRIYDYSGKMIQVSADPAHAQDLASAHNGYIEEV